MHDVDKNGVFTLQKTVKTPGKYREMQGSLSTVTDSFVQRIANADSTSLF
jgi:hypothetical protein